jgi:DNA-binding transcriptional ArsR family regulator
MSPVRRPGTPPTLTVEHSPAYELLHAIIVALDESDTYEIGPEWVQEARSRAGEELVDRTRAISLGDDDTFHHLVALAYDTPAPRDIPAFLDHLRETDPDEIRLHLVQFYARETRRMTPAAVIRAAVGGDPDARAEFIRTCHPDHEEWNDYLRRVLEVDAKAFKAELIDVLEAWHERVWKPESLTILPILERDADAKRELRRELAIDRFVVAATNGVEYAPRPGIDRLVMIPSFVSRPVVSFVEFGAVFIIVYPVADESISFERDVPPPRLVRLSKALGDEKRLRILRALADGEKSLMELAEMFGVAKTTMHHHMIVLRSAGLISVATDKKRYRLRHETVPDVGALLNEFLGAGPEASAAERSSPKVASGR